MLFVRSYNLNKLTQVKFLQEVIMQSKFELKVSSTCKKIFFPES